MSEKKDKKLPIKITTLNLKSQGNDLNQPCEADITEETPEQPKPVITTEISTRPKIVGEIPPWDDDEDFERDITPKPPTVTAEIPLEEDKFDAILEITGEIPPWDDEEEIKQ